MAVATLERGNTSVSLPLLSDSSGTPLVVRSIGKPNLNIQETGAINPRSLDQWSGLEQYTLTGRFDGPTAYSDAITLCDLIKANGDGEAITLNIDMPDYDSDMSVVPGAGQDSALSVVTNPGWRNYVEVDLSLTRVSDTLGGGDQPANTPTANGSGPITLSDGVDTVELTSDIEVTRSVGRPQDVVRRSPNNRDPIHISKFKTASDTFELSFEFSEDTVTETNKVVDIFRRQLGRNSLTLDFQGLFGLGAFDVVPDGSEAVRHNRQAGYKSSGLIPSVTLRRVLDQTA
jgi:hypothetical protein